MTDKPQPDKFDWATELSDAQGHVTLSAQEAKEIGARLRSMSAKLKAHEDHAAELRRLHAYCQELESQVIRDCMTHVQNPAEIVNRYCRAGMCVPSDTKHEPWCTAHRDRER